MWSGSGLGSLFGGGCQGCPGPGPGASEVVVGSGRRAWHDDVTPAVWGAEGAHCAPRRSEIYVFPLEIRVPTRPGLERLMGMASVHGLVRGKARAEPTGFRRRRVRGSRAPSCGTVAGQEGGAEGGPSAATDLFSTRGPGRTQMGDCIFGASCRRWPYKFFVTRWVL